MKISNQFLVEFTGCTNSSAKDDKDCVNAIDGNVGPYGWQAHVPAWAIFELTEERSMNSLVLISGTGSPKSFKVTLKVDGQWINLSALQIKEDPTAQIENDGTVTLNSGIDELTLEFTTVTNVQSIRLNVTKSNLLVATPSTNPTPYLYLREIIPEFFGKF